MIVFNQEQEYVIHKAVNHVINHINYGGGNDLVYQFGGKAGTGKTEVIKEIIRRINIPMTRVAIMTYIGQAAIVLRTRGLYTAKTAHSTLYEYIEEELKDEYGNTKMDPTFNIPMIKMIFRPRELYDVDYFVIDEARTMPMSMKKEIESRGKPIIACGDWRQLPPVADEPAYLRDEDIPNIDILVTPIRQKAGANILMLADMVYDGYQPSCGYYGDVLVIERDELNDVLLDNADMIICGRNNTRDHYNKRIREIRGFSGRFPHKGERLICRKNDWKTEIAGISLANGLIGTVINEPTVYNYDGKDFTIDFLPDMLDIPFSDLRCDSDYFTAPFEKKALLKNDKYHIGKKFEFANCITTHLSQGAQYRNGIYIKEFLGGNNNNCLDYTGVTRFSNLLLYVLPNTKKRYY